MKKVDKAYVDGVHFTVQTYSAVVLLCLKDKFNFTTEQLKEMVNHINNTFDSVCDGYLTLEDIRKTLIEETNIKITFEGKDDES